MTQKDLVTKEHLVLFSKEEIDQGYKYCNDIAYALKNRFPGHTFVCIPDTITVKELGKEAARAVIDELQEYLDSRERMQPPSRRCRLCVKARRDHGYRLRSRYACLCGDP